MRRTVNPLSWDMLLSRAYLSAAKAKTGIALTTTDTERINELKVGLEERIELANESRYIPQELVRGYKTTGSREQDSLPLTSQHRHEQIDKETAGEMQRLLDRLLQSEITTTELEELLKCFRRMRQSYRRKPAVLSNIS